MKTLTGIAGAFDSRKLCPGDIYIVPEVTHCDGQPPNGVALRRYQGFCRIEARPRYFPRPRVAGAPRSGIFEGILPQASGCTSETCVDIQIPTRETKTSSICSDFPRRSVEENDHVASSKTDRGVPIALAEIEHFEIISDCSNRWLIYLHRSGSSVRIPKCAALTCTTTIGWRTMRVTTCLVNALSRRTSHRTSFQPASCLAKAPTRSLRR